MIPGFKPIVVVLVVCGLCACLLVGWAVAFYWDRQARQREKEEAEMQKRADEAAKASGESPTPD